MTGSSAPGEKYPAGIDQQGLTGFKGALYKEAPALVVYSAARAGNLPGTDSFHKDLSEGGKGIMVVETKEKAKVAAGFKPLKDRCFVSYTEELERTAGGIYIPDAAKEQPQRGRIEAVGADVKSVKVGDIVLVDKYSGSKNNVDGTEY